MGFVQTYVRVTIRIIRVEGRLFRDLTQQEYRQPVYGAHDLVTGLKQVHDEECAGINTKTNRDELTMYFQRIATVAPEITYRSTLPDLHSSDLPTSHVCDIFSELRGIPSRNHRLPFHWRIR